MRIRPLLTALAALLLTPAAAMALPDNGDIKVIYEKVAPANRGIADALKRSGGIDRMVAEVNANVALPRDIQLGITDDLPKAIAEGGPAYYRKANVIVIPGGFLTRARRDVGRQFSGFSQAVKLRAAVAAIEFVAAHEIGHALTDQLDIPITGKEEDAVDGFAAFLLIDNPGFGPLTALAAAAFFDAVAASQGELTEEDFADEHSILQQRVYQFLCWTYGSNPKEFKSIVGKQGLPRARAVRCGEEYKQVVRSWSRLLATYGARDPS